MDSDWEDRKEVKQSGAGFDTIEVKSASSNPANNSIISHPTGNFVILTFRDSSLLTGMGFEYSFGFNSENSVSEFFANFLVLAVVPCASRSPSWISPPALFFFRFATEDIGSHLVSGFSDFAVDFLALWFVNLFYPHRLG